MAAKKEDGGIVELIKTIVYALILAGIIRTLLFQPFWIPSGSMKSTLLIGDFLFVNKFAYGYSKHSCPFSMCPFEGRILANEPERGDVIVFLNPSDHQVFIKRLIGLPGDKIQMKAGVLYINEKAVPKTPDSVFIEGKAKQGPMGNWPRCSNHPVAFGGECEKKRFVETLPNGVKHATLDIVDEINDNTAVFTVPDGKYFFMGDNRDNSQDSRVSARIGGVGYVPFELLIGRADRIMFSSAGSSILAFWTWRSDRFFKAVE